VIAGSKAAPPRRQGVASRIPRSRRCYLQKRQQEQGALRRQRQQKQGTPQPRSVPHLARTRNRGPPRSPARTEANRRPHLQRGGGGAPRPALLCRPRRIQAGAWVGWRSAQLLKPVACLTARPAKRHTPQATAHSFPRRMRCTSPTPAIAQKQAPGAAVRGVLTVAVVAMPAVATVQQPRCRQRWVFASKQATMHVVCRELCASP
jgi:hypothetical protein